MNTGQMMLAAGAMVLLSLVVLRVNNTFLSTNTVMQESKFGVLATSLAQSVIEEAESKAFDELSISNPTTSPNDFTPVNSLGIEGETYPNFDDFDDYNNYTKDVTNLPSAIFHISCRVNYFDPTNPNVAATTKQWSKKITVTVTSESSQDTIRLSSIFSYFQ